MTQRSKGRKAVSMILGGLLAVGGLLGFGWMWLHASEPVKIWIWLVPITVFGAGVAILWDDLREG
jgi:hypothetical protein